MCGLGWKILEVAVFMHAASVFTEPQKQPQTIAPHISISWRGLCLDVSGFLLPLPLK